MSIIRPGNAQGGKGLLNPPEEEEDLGPCSVCGCQGTARKLIKDIAYCLDHFVKMSDPAGRQEAVANLVASQAAQVQDVRILLRHYLRPIGATPSIMSTREGLAIEFFAFVQHTKDLLTFEEELLEVTNRALEHNNEAELIKAVVERFERGVKSMLIPYIKQLYALSGDFDKEATTVMLDFINQRELTFLEFLDEPDGVVSNLGGQSPEQFTTLVMRPIAMVEGWRAVVCDLLDYTSACHESFPLLASAEALMAREAAAVREVTFKHQSDSYMSYLDKRIKGVPDGWNVTEEGRACFFTGELGYIYDGIGGGFYPENMPDWPFKNKRGEALCAYLMTDVLLLTTAENKYRYRLKLSELTVAKKDQYVFVLFQDMFGNQDLTLVGGQGSAAALLCPTEYERDRWVLMMSDSIRRAKALYNEEMLQQAQEEDDQDAENKSRSLVTVALRVRPCLTEEELKDETSCISITDNVATLNQDHIPGARRAARVGLYDVIFPPDTTQEELFEGVGREVIGAVLSGFNAAVMAYGCTGAGKTHTMFGENEGIRRGLIPRLLESIFGQMTMAKYHKSKVTMSFVEVYNDKVRDLQAQPDASGHLKDLKVTLVGANTHIKKLIALEVDSADAALKAVTAANANRATRAHKMNAHSSRSHVILILNVQAFVEGNKKPAVSSTVHLVDLAGSENTTITGVSDEGAREASHINKSLISLGRIINALNENRRRTKGKQLPVPYRESKLTLLMREVFSRKFVCTLVLNTSQSPVQGQAAQTAKTMAFGDGLKRMGAAADNGDDDNKQKSWLSKLGRKK